MLPLITTHFVHAYIHRINCALLLATNMCSHFVGFFAGPGPGCLTTYIVHNGQLLGSIAQQIANDQPL